MTDHLWILLCYSALGGGFNKSELYNNSYALDGPDCLPCATQKSYLHSQPSSWWPEEGVVKLQWVEVQWMKSDRWII